MIDYISVYNFFGEQKKDCIDDRRAFQRFPTNKIWISVAYPTLWKFHPKSFHRHPVVDINRSGCSLICDREFKDGQVLLLTLQLKGVLTEKLYGQVVNKIEDDGGFRYGFRFLLNSLPRAEKEFTDILLKLLESEVKYTWNEK